MPRVYFDLMIAGRTCVNKSVEEKGHLDKTCYAHTVHFLFLYIKSLYVLPFKSLTSVPLEEQSIMRERRVVRPKRANMVKYMLE